MYALARTLGLGLPGSLLAALAYACNGFLYGHNVCCFAYAGVAAWLPLIILGAERAIQAPTRRQRGFWWAVSGLALSQVFAVWVGQGAYYVVLTLVAYLAYRRVTPVPRSVRALGARLVALALDTLGIFLFGLGLAAAALLPRLEFNLLSNLPLGYPDSGSDQASSAVTDWALIDSWSRLLLTPGFYSLGVSVAAAALTTILLAPRQRGVAFCAVLSLVSIVLAQQERTPLHQALSVLPGFERVTGRSPERALLVLYLGPALLAGSSLAAIRRAPRWAGLLAPVLVTGALAKLLAGQSLPVEGIGWLIATTGLLAMYPVLPRGHALFSATLVLVVYADLRSASAVQLADAQAGSAAYELHKVDLADYYQPTGAARFLQAMQAGDDFRYVGYAGHVFGGPFPYTLRWADPGTRLLEVNNRALLTGLHDVQGYDPIHIARYDRFVAAMNGREQNYHHADVLDSGLDSPLLDLLNVRYLVMPAAPAPDQTIPRLSRPLQVVFQNEAVTVFENLSALPRSWIVHTAQQVSLDDALNLLARRAVDPRRVALLEAAPPDLAPMTDPLREQSSVTGDQPEHLRLHVGTDAPGLVMLSEVYYPAWRAYVDGQPAPVYVADAVLRAVPVPAGEHEVELRYESPTLAIGLVISLTSSAGLAVLAAASALERRAACG